MLHIRYNEMHSSFQLAARKRFLSGAAVTVERTLGHAICLAQHLCRSTTMIVVRLF